MYALVMTCAYETHEDLCFEAKYIKFPPQFHHIISRKKSFAAYLKTRLINIQEN